MGLTIIGGLIFLGSQAWEWSHFISGDKGAVKLEDGTVVHVVNPEGEIMSLHELILHEPKEHGNVIVIV